MGSQKDWNNDMRNAIKLNQKYRIKLNETSLKIFKKFVLECKNDSINLIFVSPSLHVEGQVFIENRDSIQKIFTEISVKNKIPFIDYTNDSINYKKEYFYNALHLNLTGANIFSKKVSNKLKEFIK